MPTGPGHEGALAEAQAAVQAYVDERRKVGATIHRSALFAALHRPGVEAVKLRYPSGDVKAPPTGAPWVTSISIEVAT